MSCSCVGCSSIFLINYLFLSLSSFKLSTALSNLTSSTPLLQDQTLTSLNDVYQLGFFNNARNQYVGIWYKKVSPKRVVWVANRDNPVTDSASRFLIDAKDWNLKVVDGKNATLWSTNVSVNSNSSVAELLETGNLVLRDGVSGVTIWESFLHPADTVLPSRVKAYDLNTGERFVLNAWRSEDDPSPGIFTVSFSLTSPPQAVVFKNSRPYWRSGQWDKSKFVGVPEMDTSYESGLTLLDDPKQGTGDLVVSNLRNCSYSFLVLTFEGSLRILCYDTVRKWYPRFAAPLSSCEVYGACGAYGICERKEPLVCTCLRGFRPKSLVEWSNGNWSGGCVRQTSLACEQSGSNSSTTDGFLEVGNLKIPDLSDFYRVWDENECRHTCLSNCSCKAYSYPDGIGCLIWTGEDLMDINVLPFGGQKLFLRVAHSELKEGNKRWIIIVACLVGAATLCLIAAMIYCFLKLQARRVTRKSDSSDALQPTWRTTLEEQDSLELPMLDFQSILAATNNFDVTKKLGQGGYGPVYKGKLQDGKYVAIKRLASTSVQGVEEFKNEITLISKLQHRNLVKLLAYCIDKEEKILIYEYMSNKSLDTYLFDETKKTELDWARRFNIIHGIARGLLYLHRDSCLRIIHRDLKVSNILLDEKMNPKISDFGLARIFQGTQDLANTSRVVGTLGYMAPEYLLGGVFSEKSDVFSFGVLMLEIISGRKISSFHNDEKHLSLLSFAWQSWCESQGLSFTDEALVNLFSPSEAARCVNVALLCVQDHATDRPAMPAVVSMLNGETRLPEPKQPTFMFQTASVSNIQIQSKSSSVCSINNVTETIIEGR